MPLPHLFSCKYHLSSFPCLSNLLVLSKKNRGIAGRRTITSSLRKGFRASITLRESPLPLCNYIIPQNLDFFKFYPASQLLFSCQILDYFWDYSASSSTPNLLLYHRISKKSNFGRSLPAPNLPTLHAQLSSSQLSCVQNLTGLSNAFPMWCAHHKI
nr:MAG TPA: hypothetical protein [Caudoviricetes sp.]